jgi:hypothetical protein
MPYSNYSMYRFFKGEKENPFDNQKENTAYQFWEYESMFEYKFNNDITFKEKDKTASFETWLNNLFTRLSDKYDCFDNGEHFRIKYHIG